MDYFTSDLHLGHANSIRQNNRPFNSVEEMNEKIIQNINDVVGADDELWIEGDFSFKVNEKDAKNFLQQIICKNVHLLRGNHDKDFVKNIGFVSVDDRRELQIGNGLFIVMDHYPIDDWHGKHHGSIHLHGHIHSDGAYNERNRNTLCGEDFPEGHQPKREFSLRKYDVGVDANNYKPVSLDEILEFFSIDKPSL